MVAAAVSMSRNPLSPPTARFKILENFDISDHPSNPFLLEATLSVSSSLLSLILLLKKAIRLGQQDSNAWFMFIEKVSFACCTSTYFVCNAGSYRVIRVNEKNFSGLPILSSLMCWKPEGLAKHRAYRIGGPCSTLSHTP